MAAWWQQLVSVCLGQFLICCLCPPSNALLSETKVSSSSAPGFEVLTGNFSRTFLRVGYHKITVIPAGACNISIKEAVKTRNYIALKTHTGDSIVNGNWVIDKPGISTALGTQFTYRRPNEIRSRTGESISAPGPLTDDLHVYLIYQQPGIRVYYEYMVPLKTTSPPPQTTTPSATPGPTSAAAHTVDKGVTSNEIFSETPNVVPLPTYTWIKAGHTECSSSCGTGRRRMILECVDKDSMMAVAAHLCDGEPPNNQEEECNTEACPAYWDVGEWSECSKRCGPGTQLRQVLCRQVTNVHQNGTENSVTVASELCGSTDRPVTTSTCQLKICSQWEIRSEWTTCSVPCGLGQRSREVACVSNQGEVEPDQECNMNLKPDALQNCDMGTCARSWFTSLWSEKCSAACGQGTQARTTVCLTNHVTDLPLDSCDGERPLEDRPCDSGPCQNRLEWYTGPWGQCSAECGNGTQTRSVACILDNNSLVEVVDHSRCSGLPQQVTVQPCMLKPCGVQWYVTEWSECSLPCSGGFRVREVRCLTDNFAPSDLCDPNLTPNNREDCNKQPCKAEITPTCSDQYHNCVVVVQARLCVYNYYRSVCCASCAKAQKAYPYSFQKNHIRR